MTRSLRNVGNNSGLRASSLCYWERVCWSVPPPQLKRVFVSFLFSDAVAWAHDHGGPVERVLRAGLRRSIDIRDRG